MCSRPRLARTYAAIWERTPDRASLQYNRALPTTSAPGVAPSFGAMCAECSQIVHRDVKAPNVLLREVESRWDVCISDFGAAACP